MQNRRSSSHPELFQSANKPRVFPRLLLPGLIAAATWNPSALAQGSSQSVLEEILVTSQKREQSMQDVSVAVSAFSGEAIEKMGFEEGLDITQQVPNMNFFAIFGEASSPSVSLRGISLVNFSDSWESPVAIYVDDVYRGNPAGSAIQLFDLQRVEVLRGPQGTLYGRNTTGGLVHYVSKKPTDIFEASANLSYGSYNEVIAEGMVSGPFSDSIRGRLAVKTTQNDGWQENAVGGETREPIEGSPYVVPDDKLNDTDSLGYRGLLEFDLGMNGSLLLNVHGSEADQQSVGFAHMGYLTEADADAPTCAISRIQNGECTSATFGMTGQEAVRGNFDPEHVASGSPSPLTTEIETFGTSATLEWEFDNFNFTSITALEELDKFLQDDGDGTEIIWFDEQYSADASQFTQELRLDGASTNGKWVTGLYFFDDSRDLLTEAPTTGGADYYGGYFHREYVELNSESWALFGQYEYDFTPEWTGIIGARYTEEERDFWLQSGPTFYEPFDIRDTFEDDSFTGKLGLDWRPKAGTLIYGSVSTGFKSGGYSASYNALREASDPVDSEDITNFEVGLKTDLADGRVRLNAAAFTYEVEGYQAQVFLTVAEGSVITNAGDVRGTGAEVEVTAQVTDNFELIAGAGFLDTEFSSGQIFKVAGDEYTLDGNELPTSPGFTYNFVARYYLGLGNGSEMVFQGDYSWQDDHYLQIENDPYSKHDAYGLANAKISWHSPDARYSVSAFANNLLDEEYFTYQNTLGDDWGYGVWGQPRTVGARFSWTY